MRFYHTEPIFKVSTLLFSISPAKAMEWELQMMSLNLYYLPRQAEYLTCMEALMSQPHGAQERPDLFY